MSTEVLLRRAHPSKRLEVKDGHLRRVDVQAGMPDRHRNSRRSRGNDRPVVLTAVVRAAKTTVSHRHRSSVIAAFSTEAGMRSVPPSTFTASTDPAVVRRDAAVAPLSEPASVGTMRFLSRTTLTVAPFWENGNHFSTAAQKNPSR